MIDADHFQRAPAGFPNGLKVFLRIDEITPPWIDGLVSRSHRVDDFVSTTQEQPTALCRGVVPRMCHDGGFDECWQLHTSITIAMPIPPPMHRLATPRPPPRFFNA